MRRVEFGALPLLGALLPVHEQIASDAAAPYVFARQEFVRRAMLPFRHRQVFAARPLRGGVVLHLMLNSLKAYNAPGGFGEGPDSLHAAAVLYGTSIAALLDDAAWNELALPSFLQGLGDLPAGAVTQNPYTAVVRDLVQSHASFFVCNNALHDVAQALASSTTGKNPSAETVYIALRRGLRPEALVVPAGVAALNALQEHRFTLVQATV